MASVDASDPFDVFDSEPVPVAADDPFAIFDSALHKGPGVTKPNIDPHSLLHQRLRWP